jgi:hypothetical protein
LQGVAYLGANIGIGVFQSLGPGVQVGPQPGEGLFAPAGSAGCVEVGGVAGLAALGLGSTTGGGEAVAGGKVFDQFGIDGGSIGVQPGRARGVFFAPGRT